MLPIKYNQSYNSLENVAQIINSMDNAAIKIPESKYRIIKEIDPMLKVEMHIFCANCKNYTPTNSSTVACQDCSKLLKTAHSHFFCVHTDRATAKKGNTRALG